MESCDKLNELFANDNEFTLHRLLSDIGVNDMNIDMNDLSKFDPMKLLDTRSISEFVSGKKFYFCLNCEITHERKEKEYSYRNYRFFVCSSNVTQLIFNQIILTAFHHLQWLVPQGHFLNFVHQHRNYQPKKCSILKQIN